MYKFICWRDAGAIFLQDSAGPRQIVCDLPMTQRGPAEEAGWRSLSWNTGSKKHSKFKWASTLNKYSWWVWLHNVLFCERGGLITFLTSSEGTMEKFLDWVEGVMLLSVRGMFPGDSVHFENWVPWEYWKCTQICQLKENYFYKPLKTTKPSKSHGAEESFCLGKRQENNVHLTLLL